MTEIIVVILLLFITILVAIADILLLLIAGIKFFEKEKKKGHAVDEGYDGFVFNPPGNDTGETGQLVVPHNQMGNFLAHMAKRAGIKPADNVTDTDKEKKPYEPQGYM